jgi:hypothetical protein
MAFGGAGSDLLTLTSASVLPVQELYRELYPGTGEPFGGTW